MRANTKYVVRETLTWVALIGFWAFVAGLLIILTLTVQSQLTLSHKCAEMGGDWRDKSICVKDNFILFDYETQWEPTLNTPKE